MITFDFMPRVLGNCAHLAAWVPVMHVANASATPDAAPQL